MTRETTVMPVGTCTYSRCDEPVRCKGLCAVHYKRQIRGLNMDAPIIHRAHRTPAEMMEIETALYALAEQEQPTTCRHLFYRLLTYTPAVCVHKTEDDYDMVVRLLSEMRLHERTLEVPWEWIVDNTRAVQQPLTFSSTDHACSFMKERYRRRLWDNQKEHVEIWIEKDAIAGLLYSVTEKYDVPLVPVRGHSLGFVHDCLTTIAETGKPTFIFYLVTWMDTATKSKPRLKRTSRDSKGHHL